MSPETEETDMNTPSSTLPEPAPARRGHLATGTGFIALGVYLNIPYTALALMFDYPDILRRPAGEILARFAAGGTGLVLVWYAFVAAALALIPLALGASRTLRFGGWAATAGVLAGVFQALGLARWVFVVPWLAETAADPATSPAAREAVFAVFEALHRFAGVAVGEHLGQLATAAWAAALSLGWRRSGQAGPAESALGLGAAGLILIGLAEGFGTVLPVALDAFGLATLAGYLVLSVWMVVAGWRLVRPALTFKRRSRSLPGREMPAASVRSSV